MTLEKNYETQINFIKGKTIGIVYIFEGEDAPGASHYWIWKSDIISGWLMAIQELKCVPYIMDVRTFIQKAVNRTLPHIDYILNLNCGNYEISSMSLVPSMCSFLSIPCIPCDAAAIVMSENKHISNLLADIKGIQVPATLSPNETTGIFRPLNLGSSIGVQIGQFDWNNPKGIYQEFIPGYDITFPIAYNPDSLNIDLLPPLIYIPKSNDPNWIYDVEEKYTENENFIKCPLHNISSAVSNKLLDFARTFPITTFGRIDGRIKCNSNTLSLDIVNQDIKYDDLYFVEINSMPTIEREDSFELSFQTAKNNAENPFYRSINQYCSIVEHPTMIGYILASSIIACSRAKSQNQMDLIHNEL